MDNSYLIIIGVFLIAGFAKGTVGFGLPTISMGILASFMPPPEAAALMLLPSIVTNVWQMLQGARLAELLRMFWPTLIALCLGTWLGQGWMEGAGGTFGTALVGVTICLYALIMLSGFELSLPRGKITGVVVGLLTGLVNAATGVFVIPAVPYLQTLGLEKGKLVQTLGLFFTVSTAALAINLFIGDALSIKVGPASLIALIAALCGMIIGRKALTRLSAVAFRRVFQTGLLGLGIWLVLHALLG